MLRALAAGFLLFLACGGAVAGPQDTLLIGGDAKYPPYEFLDENNRPSGFSVELSQALGRVMGVTVTIRLDSWDVMRAAFDAGEIDVLQGMSYSEERARQVDFSPPYTLIHHSIFVREGTTDVTTLDALSGKTVLVQRNGIMHDTLKAHPMGIIPVPVDYQADALRQLSAGIHDYAVVAHLPGLYFIREYGLSNIRPVGRPVAVQKYGYAVRKSDPELTARITEALAILKKTGQLGRIHRKWLGVLEPGLTMTQVLRTGGAVFLILVVMILVSLLWSRSLKKQVALRTRELHAEIEARKKAADELAMHQKQLVQADKMASLGYLVSGIAHELNNPNGLILMNLPVLSDAFDDAAPILDAHYAASGDFMLGGLKYSRMRDEIPHMLTETRDAALRIRSIVDDLKDFGRQRDDDHKEAVDLNALTANALRLVKTALETATRRVTVTYGRDLPTISVNPQRVEQVIINLVLNACQALDRPDQAITVTTERHPESGRAVLIVADEGCGIDEEHLPHLTDPFFTTRRAEGGTGLGLSVSAGIVKAQQGTLDFVSTPGQGTTVRLSFPPMDGVDEKTHEGC
ncbi:transporter substrate-binding domain-containing protein [Desulfatiferula olefinivorans]